MTVAKAQFFFVDLKFEMETRNMRFFVIINTILALMTVAKAQFSFKELSRRQKIWSHKKCPKSRRG